MTSLKTWLASKAFEIRMSTTALRTSAVTGIRTNLASLEAICREADFLAARTPTSYLGGHPEVLTPSGPEGDDLVALLLGGVFALEAVASDRRDVLHFAPSGWRNVRTVGQRQLMLRDGEEHPVEYAFRTRDRVDVLVGRWPEPTDDGTLLVHFDESQRAVAPGQFVVFYDAERCLGGGVIQKSVPIS